MTREEVIEKYLAELCDRTDDFYKHEFENVLTRFASELQGAEIESLIAAAKDVGRMASSLMGELGPRPKVERVQLEKLLMEWSVFKQYISTVLEFNGKGIDWSQGRWNEMDSRFMDLRAAISAAGGGK